MKSRIVFALALAVGAGTNQVSAADVKVQIYDAGAAVTTNKGNELTKKGDYETARQYYDAAIRRDPKEWPSYYDRGLLYAQERKWELAPPGLRYRVSAEPRNAARRDLAGCDE